MRKRVIWTTALCCAMGFSLAACVPNVEPEESEHSESVVIADAASAESGLEGAASVLDAQGENYAPVIKTLDDGRQIQKTPDSAAGYVYPFATSSYNTYYLNADNRGCESCHQEGLNEVLKNMSYKHYDLDNGLGTNIDVIDCKGCHDELMYTMSVKEQEFGNVVHGIHSKDSFKGDCMTCHTATADGTGLRLWEEARYDVLSGINQIENVDGGFSFDQDKLGGDNIDLTWWPGSVDEEGVDLGFKDEAPDTSAYETWAISVSGMVDTPKEWTLSELIEQAPIETFVSSSQCVLNPSSGELIANAEVTGIPVSWILEQVGVKDGATTVRPVGADGYEMYANSIENIDENDGWIIYEINGRPLSHMDGFPCRMWFPDHAIPNSPRWLTEIVIDDSDVYLNDGMGLAGVENSGENWVGDENSDAEFYNKPNVAICNTPEGLIVPVGEAYSFEGYAEGMNESIVAMEFSMDGGQTWTTFETPNTDKKKWTYWYFEFTPEEPGAYVLSARAVTDQGRVSYQPDQVMFNAK